MDRFYTEDQKALRDSARRFAQTEILPRAAAIDRDDRFDRSLYKGMADLGLFGICLREGAGGAGLDAVAACIAMEELARCSGAVGNAYAIPVEAVLFFNQHGTETHKALIPEILGGKLIPATAVSEPDHGSDVAGMKTTAMRDGDGYVINGTKAWVTFGGVADLIVVFAKTSAEPDTATSAAFWSKARCRASRAANTKSCSACTAWRIARSPSRTSASRPRAGWGRRTRPSRWR